MRAPMLTGGSAERALLVGVELKGQKALFSVEDSLQELAQLALTCGIEVKGSTVQRLVSPRPATFIGKGKVEEIKIWSAELGADVVIFDTELSHRQLRDLEESLEVKILDRTALILDIFAQHAHSHEGRLQVELAQYEYRLPRLTRLWTHLARQVGGGAGRGGPGGVGLRGPGETQLETDRRLVRERIAHLKRELEEVRTHRRLYRQRRNKAAIPVVAIVGYTNAGKSTLLNAISGSDVLVEDKLFATLDPTTRRVGLPDGRTVLFTDTVGFIQKLPHQLVAAFQATLEEITEADLLVHVADVTHPNVQEQVIAVEQTLRELGADKKPIVTALNKIDLLDDHSDDYQQGPEEIASRYPNCVPISAAKRLGLGLLLKRVGEVLREDLIAVKVCLPYAKSDLVSLLHSRGSVVKQRYTRKGIIIEGSVPQGLEAVFGEYLVTK